MKSSLNTNKIKQNGACIDTKLVWAKQKYDFLSGFVQSQKQYLQIIDRSFETPFINYPLYLYCSFSRFICEVINHFEDVLIIVIIEKISLIVYSGGCCSLTTDGRLNCVVSVESTLNGRNLTFNYGIVQVNFPNENCQYTNLCNSSSSYVKYILQYLYRTYSQSFLF